MFKTLLSPLLVIIAVIILPSTGKALVFLPMILSLAVSLPNHDKFKVKYKALGIFISILQSYTVFAGLGISLYLLDEFMPEIYIGENDFNFKGIALVTFGGYLAALLLFYFYSFLFRLTYLRISFIVITICYAFVVLVMQIFSNNEFLQFGVEKFTSFLISWLIFMSFAYSLCLNNIIIARQIKH